MPANGRWDLIRRLKFKLNFKVDWDSVLEQSNSTLVGQNKRLATEDKSCTKLVFLSMNA